MPEQVRVDVLLDAGLFGALFDNLTHPLGRKFASTDTEENPRGEGAAQSSAAYCLRGPNVNNLFCAHG